MDWHGWKIKSLWLSGILRTSWFSTTRHLSIKSIKSRLSISGRWRTWLRLKAPGQFSLLVNTRRAYGKWKFRRSKYPNGLWKGEKHKCCQSLQMTNCFWPSTWTGIKLLMYVNIVWTSYLIYLWSIGSPKIEEGYASDWQHEIMVRIQPGHTPCSDSIKWQYHHFMSRIKASP